MSNKPPYLSGGRGRGQSSQKRTGYSIGNLVIDRKAEKKKGKMDTKSIVAADSKYVAEKRKQQKVYQVEDTGGGDIINSEIDNDTPVEDEQDLRQEQILENVVKSYKEGNSDSKC